MACLLGVEPSWHSAVLAKGSSQTFWINIVGPTGEIKESTVRVKGLVKKRCEIEEHAPAATSSVDAAAVGSHAAAEREELAVVAAESATQHSAHVPARLSSINLLESDGVSSIGLEVSLSLQAPVIAEAKAAAAAVQTIYAFAPVMAWRSAAASELSEEREPLPRVHCVALSHGATGIAFGCANARAYACGLPPLPVEDGEEDGEEAGDAAAAAACAAVPPPVRVLSHGESVQLEGPIADVTCAAWFPSDKVILSGGSDLRLRIHDAATGACAATLAGHAGGIAGVAIVERGRQVVSVARDRTLRVWSVPDKAVRFSVPLGDAAPTAAALLDGRSIAPSASVPVDGAATAATAAAAAGTVGGPGAAASDADAALRGKAVAVPCDDGLVRIVDLASRAIVASLPLVPADAVGLPGSLAAVLFGAAAGLGAGAGAGAVESAIATAAAGGAGAASGSPATSAAAEGGARAGVDAAAGGASKPVAAASTGSDVPSVRNAAPAPWWCSYASGHKALCVSIWAATRRDSESSAAAAPADSVAAAAAAAPESGQLRMLVGGTDGHVSLWDVAPLYDARSGSWSASSSSSADAAAAQPLLIWRGQVSLTGAEVLSVELLPSLNIGGQHAFIAALSDGTCAVFAASECSTQPRCLLQLTGPNCEAVRGVSVRGTEGNSPYVTIATACNDGFCRLYRVPRHILFGPA